MALQRPAAEEAQGSNEAAAILAKAGAYTRSLLTQPELFMTLSTSPKRLSTPSIPALNKRLTPPKYPLSHQRSYIELTGGRV